MKIFGRVSRQAGPEGLFELSEVTFQGTPALLRAVASFLAAAADELERNPATFGHRHIQDQIKDWISDSMESPDVIVHGL